MSAPHDADGAAVDAPEAIGHTFTDQCSDDAAPDASPRSDVDGDGDGEVGALVDTRDDDAVEAAPPADVDSPDAPDNTPVCATAAAAAHGVDTAPHHEASSSGDENDEGDDGTVVAEPVTAPVLVLAKPAFDEMMQRLDEHGRALRRQGVAALCVISVHRVVFGIVAVLALVAGVLIGAVVACPGNTPCASGTVLETCAASQTHAARLATQHHGAECVALALDDAGARTKLAHIAGTLAHHLCAPSELAPRLDAPLALAAPHVGERACVAVVRLARGAAATAPGGGPLLVLANPRVVARSPETRVSEERDTLCRLDTAARFARPRALTLRYDVVVPGSGAVHELERTLVDDEASAVAHALDVLAALRVCAD